MSGKVSRRGFLGGAAAGALAVAFDPRAGSWVGQGQRGSGGLEEVPPLDGALLQDPSTCQLFSTDHGNFIRRQPRAVLKPGSVEDVVRVVRYANRHGLQVAMRGQGHSRTGETLVEAGVVIDSRGLADIRLEGESVVAEPGALLGEIYLRTLPAGLTLPAMPLCSELSLGGVLSVGGWGGTSHRFGAAVDTVQELKVVTGGGRRLACSPHQEAELFEMVLAGMGQCALILSARIALVAAPDEVVRWNLGYDRLEDCLLDQARLVVDGRFQHQAGRISRSGDAWSYRIEVGTFLGGGEEPDFGSLESELRARSRSSPERVSYREYLRPATEGKAESWSASRRNRQLGDLVMFLPGEAAAGLTRETLDILSRSPYGPASFTLVPLNLTRFRRPLFKMPAGKVGHSLWIFPRTVPAGDAPAHASLMAETRRLFDRMSQAGGKCYLAHSSVPLDVSGWEAHFGPAIWTRLRRAKARHDPGHVLNPGPGMFVPASRG